MAPCKLLPILFWSRPRRFAAVGPLLVLALSLGLSGAVGRAQAQVRPAAYWVLLRDKAGTHFNPAREFSPAAQARRRRQHLPAADSTDFPVRADYVRQIRAVADSVTLVSRWFNAVACRATPAQAAALLQLPGVRAVQLRPAAPLTPAATARPVEEGRLDVSAADRKLARQQVSSLGGAAFRRAGLSGQGLRIAIFDVGFSGADKHPAFKELYASQHVVLTHDFVRNQPNVYVGGTHGTEVLSCIAGRLPDGTPLGLAPQAEFLLARTERALRELYAEEEAWLAAAEWADRNGADIINSSLGYTDRRYFPEQMNGRTSLIARAAALAVRKGMLVVNAAGNDGEEDWHTVGTPADGDSVLAVGGLDPDTYLHSDFSSYGPTADRRLKPNVAAFGTVLAAAPGGFAVEEGTSFASPLTAGFAACAWQQERGLTVMQLFHKIEQSADLYPYFDYAHGFGAPQARFFTQGPAAAVAPTFDIVPQDSLLAVLIRVEAAVLPARTLPLYSDSVQSMAADQPGKVPPVGRETPRAQPPSDATRSAPGQPPGPAELPALPEHPDYVYWHVADRRNVLRFYEVREVSQRAVLQIPRRRLHSGDTLRVRYRGFIQNYSVQ